MAEIKCKAIDINHSVDGFEMGHVSYGGVGHIMSFKGPEMLSQINKDYEKEKEAFGERAGCHSMNSTLFQGLAIGKDNFPTSKRLAEKTFKLLQELHRPGRLEDVLDL
jgi:hypothetical protein